MPTDCIVKAPKQAQNSSHVSGFNLQHIILLLCSLEAISSFVSPKVPTKNGLGCQSNRKTVTASRELLAAVHNIGELCRDLEHQCWYRPIQFPGICGGYRPCCAAHDRHFFGVSAKLPPKMRNLCPSQANFIPQHVGLEAAQKRQPWCHMSSWIVCLWHTINRRLSGDAIVCWFCGGYRPCCAAQSSVNMSQVAIG